jgi:hypothetical protein
MQNFLFVRCWFWKYFTAFDVSFKGSPFSWFDEAFLNSKKLCWNFFLRPLPKYLVANATLLIFLFHRFVLRRVHFTYSSFAWGLHGYVDVRWSGSLLVWSGIDVFVVKVKVSRGIVPFSHWRSTVRTLINRPKGRFAWTKHIFPKNPAR